jgi:hypothetical protein
MTSAEIHNLQEHEWSALLRQFDDATIYQTRTCAEALWEKARLSHLVLRDRGEVSGLVQVATIKAPLIRAGTSLVFWGPVWRKCGEKNDLRVFRAIVEALREEFVVRQGMLLRVMPVGLGMDTDAMHEPLEKTGFLWKGRFYRTCLVDIAPPADDLRRQLRQKWRNGLNRAERENLTVFDDSAIESYDAFHTIFNEMQRHKKFTDISIDPVRLRAIQKNLPDELKMQIFLCTKGKAPLAGAVVSAIGDTAILLLAASNADGRKAMASYLLQWRIIDWLKARNIRFYDLGGISPSHPSVNHFKAGLGGDEVSHAGLFESCTNPLSIVFDRSLGMIKNLGRSARNL